MKKLFIFSLLILGFLPTTIFAATFTGEWNKFSGTRFLAGTYFNTYVFDRDDWNYSGNATAKNLGAGAFSSKTLLEIGAGDDRVDFGYQNKILIYNVTSSASLNEINSYCGPGKSYGDCYNELAINGWPVDGSVLKVLAITPQAPNQIPLEKTFQGGNLILDLLTIGISSIFTLKIFV